MSRADELYAEYIRRKKEDEKSSSTHALPSTTAPKSTTVNSLAFTAQPTGPSLSELQSEFGAVAAQNPNKIVKTDPLVSNRYSKGVDAFIPNISTTPEQQRKNQKTLQNVQKSLTSSNELLNKNLQEKSDTYSQKVNEIIKSNKDDDVKNNLAYEEQLKYEINTLQIALNRQKRQVQGLDTNKPFYTSEEVRTAKINQNLNNLGGNSRFSFNQSEEQKLANDTAALLAEKSAQLKAVQELNAPYHLMDNPELSKDLQTMYANRKDPKAVETYGKNIKAAGYDPQKMLDWYTTQKNEEILKNPTAVALLNEIYAYNTRSTSDYDDEYDDSYIEKVMKEKSGYKAPHIVAMEARGKLANMGYDVDELYSYYSAKLNREGTEALLSPVKQFAKEHPVLGAVTSIALTPLTSFGGIGAVARSVASGTPVDPNDPSMIFANTKSTIDSSVLSNANTFDGMVYKTATTLGSMLVNKGISSAVGGGQIGYGILSAVQAITSSVQEDSQKGYSVEHIATNALIVGAMNFAFSMIGFEKVFGKKTVLEKGLTKAFLKAGFSEVGEELTEDGINLAAKNITNYVFNHETEIKADAERYMSMGYGEDEAYAKVWSEIGLQLLETGAISFITGSASNVVSNSPEYLDGIARLVGRQINIDLDSTAGRDAFDKLNTNIGTASTDADSELNNAPEGVESTPLLTAPDNTENADTQANSEDAEYVTETVGDDGTVYFDFDDDFDTEPLKNLNDRQAQQTAKTIEDNRAVMHDPEATAEERNTAQSNIIKAEYEAENYEGITGEQTEAYTSGNAAVDALVNTNGRLDRTVSVLTQKEQRLVDFAAKKFNRTVRFVETLSGSNGYYDKNTGEIVIARDSQKSMLTVFGHEFMHSLEGTVEYDTFATFLRYNSPYVKAKIADAGGWDALRQNTITSYENAVGQTLTMEGAEYEIFADAVADSLFSDYNAMEQLATQNRTAFAKLKQWFVRNFIATTESRRVLSSSGKVARKTYALMLKAEQAAKNAQSSEGVAYNAKETEYVDLSKDNELSKRLTGLRGSAKYKAIRDYILEALSGNDIQLSDGKIAIVDRSDALHIANLSGDKKTSYISEINQLISRAELYAEDVNASHNKFDYFCYYRANVKYGDNIYPIYLNVGKGINDQKYHLYDITEKLRDTANRINGFERPKPNEGYALENSVSTDSISDSTENVNGNVSYSAQKSDTVQRITESFGYTDATANNIYKAARTLKQNTRSKADTDELAYTIAATLEGRRTGSTDSRDAERIAMMLAEDAKAINEDFIAENKPILDRLNGMTISISEADISDLGDAFSYVKGKLFPYVTLKKGTQSSVDSIFQDLAADFPFAFNAESATHPADQVKAIMSFIEDYRSNKYYRPYFADSEAFESLRNDVETLLGDDTIDSDTYIKKLGELVERHGELKNGAPKSSDGKTRVRQTIASFYGTEPIVNSPELSARYAKDIVNGKYDYEVMRQGKEAADYLKKIKASDNVTQTVADEYKRIKSLLMDKAHRVTPTDVVQAAALNPLLGDVLNADDYVEYTMLVAEVGTSAGQIISSLRLISQFSGPQKLKAIHKKLDAINQKQARHYKGEIESGAVADENGQFVSSDKPTGKKGVVEFVVTKQQSKYPPIKIPARLEQNLVKAKTRAEIDKATDEINKYLAEQIHYSWFDKLNAWRYFAMLSNPKTAVRNTVGNIAMGATSRMKDVVAAAISALPSKYKEGSVQTTAVKTTKEARKAATRLLVESDNVFDLFSNQDKYTGRVNEFKQGEAKLNKIEQKIAERNPLLDTIFHKRSIQPTAMASTGRAIIDKPLGKLSDIQQKMLDDTLFKTLRAKSVLAQSITQAVKKGDIENLDDFLAVALNGNTDNIDNATKIHYTQLFDTISKQAAKEGDEATFREDNEFANALNKFQSGDSKFKRVLSIAVEAIIPFKKTPANIVKRGYEYSPVSLGINLVNGRVKLAKGEIDRNTYVNEIAKGLTGTGIFLLGALLSRVGLLNVGDEDEEDEAERKLLGEQNYSLNVGDGTYTIDFLSPAALPLFMGGKVYETVVSVLDGDEIKATEFMFDILQGVAEPMFAQTMLDGIDGAFEAISMNSAYDDTAGASFIALMNYCAENWVQQFVPSFLGGIARTADDTVRSYYNEPGKDEGLLDNLMVGIKKKIPGKTDETPAKLDMWGQPMSTGTLTERLIENFISPGYYEKNTEDEATLALHEFADDNDIPYTEILPKEVPKYYDFRSKRYNLTAEEYEYYAGVIGKARKEAVEKALVDGDDIEVSYRFYDIKLANDSGITFKDVTFTGNLADATNTYGWAPSGESEGYFEYEYSDEDNKKKAIKKTAATDEKFRQFLFDAYMLEVTEKAAFEAHKEIAENRKNKKE